MKKFAAALMLSLGALCTVQAAEPQAKEAPIDTIFDQGVVNPLSQYFTGTSYLYNMSDMDDVFKTPISNVTFEPCTRTFWHYHTGGQILLVTSGEGRFQFEGEQPIALHPGDVVRIPPNVKHWHGGGTETWMSHISIMPNMPGNDTVWLDPVTDEEYTAPTADAQ